MDVVGGGRLGTGVKKSYLIGGPNEGRGGRAGQSDDGNAARENGGNARGHEKEDVRVFCIEWAGM